LQTSVRLLNEIEETNINILQDLKYWEKFRFPSEESAISETWQDVFTIPLQVISGPSVYSLSAGLKINRAQPIATFFSKAFPNPIEAILSSQDDAPEDASPPTSSDQILIQRNGITELQIFLKRTIRVPESGGTYDLPPDLGNFPIFDVRPFSNKLSASMVAKGGLFIPMYRMFLLIHSVHTII
jgi:hypothetical protein